jgi:hypothetical protein
VLPAQFGRYQLLRLLGKGGMGVVYLAHDPHLDRLVAVKIPSLMASSQALRDDLAARFLREARAAAALCHPNLCPVHDFGEIDGVCYLTMTYLEGRPLSALIRPGLLLPQWQVVTLVRQIALALQEAHDQGIIHRDLKPANVMITRKGQAVVTDFGLARRTSDRDEVRLTQPGALVGTPTYMSPEQVAGEADRLGPASDLYSLGVILYELLTGRVPFDGPLATLLPRILHEEPIPPSRFRERLDPGLQRLCLQALAKKPADRPASMSAFAAALTAARAKDGPAKGVLLDALPTADIEAVAAPRGELVPSRGRRLGGHVWMIVGGVVLLLLALLESGFSGPTGVVIPGVKSWLSREAGSEQEWSVLRRSWRAPGPLATAEQLFPPTVGAYQLRDHDRRADCPELNIHYQGWRADYAGQADIEVFVYRVSDLEREALLRRVDDELRPRRGEPRAGYRGVKGGAAEGFLTYALGNRGTCTDGIFWGDQGWLFHVRSHAIGEPGAFLKAYLARLTDAGR